MTSERMIRTREQPGDQPNEPSTLPARQHSHTPPPLAVVETPWLLCRLER